MVEAQYESFYRPIQIGRYQGYPADSGHYEYYPRKELKGHTIVFGTNGLWNNVDLDQLHNSVRGPASLLKKNTTFPDAIGVEQEAESKPLQEIANQVCSIGAYYARKGNYESPYWKRAHSQGIQVKKEGYLDDVSVVLARIGRSVQID